MEIKFHSDAKGTFKRESQQVRAFVYNDYSIEPHDHDFYELNIVLGGSGNHIIEGASISVKTGDVFMIPPKTVHAYINTKNLDVYHVLFRAEFIAENREEAEKMPGFLQLIEIEPFLRRKNSEIMLLHLPSAKLLNLMEELKFIQEEGKFDNEKMSPLHKHTAWKILYELSLELFSKHNNKSQNTENKYEYAIIGVLEYIHINYADKITVESLCKRTYLSRSTFLRSFMQICFCTPIEYLNRYRTKKARELLETGGYSKTEIAHRCGFYDLSHMQRNLKKYK